MVTKYGYAHGHVVVDANEAPKQALSEALSSDTPAKAAQRRAFDSPTQANLDRLVRAARREGYAHGYGIALDEAEAAVRNVRHQGDSADEATPTTRTQQRLKEAEGLLRRWKDWDDSGGPKRELYEATEAWL